MKNVKTTKAKTGKAVSKTNIKLPRVTAPATPMPSRTENVKASAPAPKPAATAAIPTRQITPDLIAARAYTIWESQGRPDGRDLANWLTAESQLKEEIQSFDA